jgi:pimeloyl-ACP methyl ester carboxylesterase
VSDDYHPDQEQSSGTQVAAEAAVAHPDVAGVVLASPTVDPVARGTVRLLVRWRLDSRLEPRGLSESHRPEWKRVGKRRLLHAFRAHLRHTIEEPLSRLTTPLLVIRGRDDRMSTQARGQRLAALSPAGSTSRCPARTRSCGVTRTCGRRRCAGSPRGCADLTLVQALPG